MRILFILLSALLVLPAYGQGKKTVKRNKIKTVTETRTEDSKTLTEEKTYFDREGREIERHTYNKDGELKTIHKYKYKYNSNDDVVEETELDAQGNQKEKRVVKYNNLGDKIEELWYDEKNQLKKRQLTTYDARGLKTERKTYDAQGNLKSIKKFVYTF